MRELDYTPNELARNLFHKKTGIIAVLVPTVAHPFFAEFVEYVEAELYNCGYKTMLCNTVKEENAELEYLDMLNRHIVDGVITGVHSLDVEEYLKIHKPIVALDRYLGEDIPVVAAVSYTHLNLLKAQVIELPSWAVGNSGTRYGTFKDKGAAVTIWDKIDDCAEIQRLSLIHI